MSANISFAASGLLTVIGIASVKQAKHKEQILFAALPLIFAMQQFSEGFVWLSIRYTYFAYLKTTAIHTFLVFAEVLWPLLVPISILLIEKKKWKKYVLILFLTFSLIFSSYLIYCMFNYDFNVKPKPLHLYYIQNYPDTFFDAIGSIIYVLSTILSLFISSEKSIRIFGLTILLSFLITQVLFKDTFISVWCFFEALGSAQVYFAVKGINSNELFYDNNNDFQISN